MTQVHVVIESFEGRPKECWVHTEAGAAVETVRRLAAENGLDPVAVIAAIEEFDYHADGDYTLSLLTAGLEEPATL